MNLKCVWLASALAPFSRWILSAPINSSRYNRCLLTSEQLVSKLSFGKVFIQFYPYNNFLHV